MLQLAELRQKLEELRSSASADHLAKVDLEGRQYRLHDDTSRLEKRLAAVEADRESLTHQLKVGACHKTAGYAVSCVLREAHGSSQLWQANVSGMGEGGRGCMYTTAPFTPCQAYTTVQPKELMHAWRGDVCFWPANRRKKRLQW